MRRFAIIVAGGQGLRMGGDIPKQFLPIGGKPVLMRTIEAFLRADASVQIVLVLPSAQMKYWHQLCQQYAFDVPLLLASGGETRFHSVRNGLDMIADADGVVGVHDGVRPFVSAEVIQRCYTEAEERGAVIPVIPVVETVRQLTCQGSKTVSRDEYRLVQTPQTFRVSLLRQAYSQEYRTFFTDDASVVEALGHDVCLVDGNRENIKLTTPSDLRYAEFLLADVEGE